MITSKMKLTEYQKDCLREVIEEGERLSTPGESKCFLIAGQLRIPESELGEAVLTLGVFENEHAEQLTKTFNYIKRQQDETHDKIN